MQHLFRLFAIVLCALSSPVLAQEQEVDLELVLMVDVSRSMTERELEIQRRGYAEALRSDDVFEAIQAGLLQNVALTYIEWAGSQEIIVDWRLISSRADLDAFADRLTSRLDPTLRRTSISGALAYGASRIASNDFRGLRQVIDISGDGPNNQGVGVAAARDAVLAQGIVINGLPLMTQEGIGQAWHLDQLDVYYQNCVIGGPGAFVIPVVDWADFAEAVRRKLVLEIAARPSDGLLVPAQARARDPRDCFIGEKIWEERRRIWGEP
ncbi:DUF1194 domain-containing protein [Jannaschia pohangensis]|uniref:VWFA domain-containing protein n=1 Tax=Jannaschia pohangensis TaxID=390807 RepID=A0A1I3LJ19_9RHOB|nr:DUF1194 domain-containing protein [Jannaschia pohangensis]SFI84789.1 Protein of unknown function [Jannaschia pohangensis]